MSRTGKKLGWIALWLGAAVAMNAQDFQVFDRDVQMHGFFSQGFGYSDQNNFLTMYTTHGSPADARDLLGRSVATPPRGVIRRCCPGGPL